MLFGAHLKKSINIVYVPVTQFLSAHWPLWLLDWRHKFICRRRSSLCHTTESRLTHEAWCGLRNAPRGLLTEQPPPPPTPAGWVSRRGVGGLRERVPEEQRGSSKATSKRLSRRWFARALIHCWWCARFPMLLKIDSVNETRALFSAWWTNACLQEWYVRGSLSNS